MSAVSDADPPGSGTTPGVGELLPGFAEAEAAYLGALDSLQAPDRRTHELIRLACAVILRSPTGVERHAMLAAEMGASWDDIVGTLVLTQPSFGLVPSREALTPSRTGFERGLAARLADDT